MPFHDTRLVSFSLDEIRLALPLRIVERIIRAVWITPLSGAPEVILGVIDYHGTIIAVMDLRRRLGLPSRKLRSSDRLMILRLKDMQLAVQVDDIHEVITDHSGNLHELDVRGSGRETIGIAPTEEGLAMIYDPDRFLTSDEKTGLNRSLNKKKKGVIKP